ncbi:hypothetical protein [Halobacteriovorax sp. JY17]|uniref:hypothetical protein n=1 Tax=Halobacteriovorax sp. JY17 TaxID=2014617 RepID=UPI0025C0BDD8|nr:hypothetical protein [Halobacteriovorax sp. JY17]
MKLFIITFFVLSISANSKELTGKVNVASIKKVSKSQYHILFKEKAAIYKSSSKFIKCLNISVKEKREVLIKWDINKLEIIGCKSKKKYP